VTLPLPLLILIGLLIVSAAVAAFAVVADRERRDLLGRAAGGRTTTRRSVLIGLPSAERIPLRERIIKKIPRQWTSDVRTQDQLIKAGLEASSGPAMYTLFRITSMGVLLLLGLAVAPKHNMLQFVTFVTVSSGIGWLFPIFCLERAVRLRQDRLRRSLPDAMDLLVLCVEAGLGFDAALLRVARDMQLVHPDLAREFVIINRKVNAGVVREEALRAMWRRTGVEEVRILVQHLIQSDKLGTSIAKVLRVYGETLRNKRRQSAERKAAIAPLKMTFPLASMILPALFVVILGPAVVRVIQFLTSHK